MIFAYLSHTLYSMLKGIVIDVDIFTHAHTKSPWCLLESNLLCTCVNVHIYILKKFKNFNNLKQYFVSQRACLKLFIIIYKDIVSTPCVLLCKVIFISNGFQQNVTHKLEHKLWRQSFGKGRGIRSFPKLNKTFVWCRKEKVDSNPD